jgi:hypothetical protein
VLALLDDAAAADVVLELSCALAGVLRRELSVVYVENTRSLNAASLPFAQVLAHAGAAWLPLETRDIEQGFRAQASRLRQLAARSATRHSVGWSLRVMRGSLAHAPEQLRAESDLLFVAGSSLGRLPGALRPARTQRPRPPRVRVLTLGDAASQRALAVARALVQALAGSLDVVEADAPRSLARGTGSTQGEPWPDVLVIPRSFSADGKLLRGSCPVLMVD